MHFGEDSWKGFKCFFKVQTGVRVLDEVQSLLLDFTLSISNDDDNVASFKDRNISASSVILVEPVIEFSGCRHTTAYVTYPSPPRNAMWVRYPFRYPVTNLDATNFQAKPAAKKYPGYYLAMLCALSLAP